MKKLLALLVVLFSLQLAEAQTVTTPNIGLQIPAAGSTNWNLPLNYNFNLLDQILGGTIQVPGLGLALKPVFQEGSPIISCTVNNQGQQSFDISSLPFTGYICNSLAWTRFGGTGGGGGGGVFPSGIMFGLTSITARSATAADVSALVSSQSGCTVVDQVWSPADNACIPVGTGSLTGTGTSGFLPQWTSTTSIGNSMIQFAGGLYQFNVPIQVNGPGPGGIYMTAAGGSLPALPANSAAWIGPVSGGTSYAWKSPSTWSAGALYASNASVGVDGINEANVMPVALGTIQNPGFSPDQVLSGCGIEYTSGLSFTVGACSFTLGGNTYSSTLTNLSLSAADPTNARIDLFAEDISSGVPVPVVITGTPSSTPIEPSPDPSTQLGLRFVVVPASATTPANVTNTVIFDEGTEWTVALSSNLVLSTSNPFRGTHDIQATTAVPGNFVSFTDPSSGTVTLNNSNSTTLYIRSKAAWPTGTSGSTAARYLTCQWLNGSSVEGNGIIIKDGQFGFASANVTSYQQIQIPNPLFAVGGIALTTFKCTVNGASGTSSIGFYLDAVSLQSGTSNPATPSTIMNFRGVYSSVAAYNPNDVVTVGGVNAYVALVANTNVVTTTTTTWSPLGGAGGGGGSFPDISDTAGTVGINNATAAGTTTMNFGNSNTTATSNTVMHVGSSGAGQTTQEIILGDVNQSPAIFSISNQFNSIFRVFGSLTDFTQTAVFESAGTFNQSALQLSGTIGTAGSTSSNAWPNAYFNLNSRTQPTDLNANGGAFGINAQSGFTGDFFYGTVNGAASSFRVNYQGNLTSTGVLKGAGVTDTALTPGSIVCSGTGGALDNSSCSGGGNLPTANTNHVFYGDSLFAVSASCIITATPSYGSITAGSITSGVLTATAVNTQQAGNVILLSTFGGGFTGLNGQLVTVLSAGLSGTQFEANVTGGLTGSTGAGKYGCAYNIPARAATMTAFAGHGTVTDLSDGGATTATLDSNYSTTAHNLSPSVTGNPGVLYYMGSTNDWVNVSCTTAATEANVASVFHKAHVDGYRVVYVATPTVIAAGNVNCPAAVADAIAFNQWARAQSKSGVPAQTTSDSNWDGYVDSSQVLDDFLDANMFLQPSSPDAGHFADGGTEAVAGDINTEQTVKGTVFHTVIPQSLSAVPGTPEQLIYQNVSGALAGVGYIGQGSGSHGQSTVLEIASGTINLTDDLNTVMGYNSFTNTSSGSSGNVIIGALNGFNNNGSSESNSVFVGESVNFNKNSCSSCVLLGQGSGNTGGTATNMILIGQGVTGGTSNSTQIGNSSTTQTILEGTLRIAGSAPAASVGTITGSNSGGLVALTTATSVTLTFANSGWTTWAACVATPSVADVVTNTSQSVTAVTFTFATAFTGTLYYGCQGN